MKTVFPNAMVAHVWAAQSQDAGRSNNGNFYFEGRSLYSYGGHFVAGYVLPRPNGAPIYLVNADSYSISTNRHLSYARQAVPGDCLLIPDLTSLARTMDSILNVWEYPKDCNGRTKPTPRRASMKERRDGLPRIKSALLANWPSERAATRILAAFGQAEAQSCAGAMGRKVAREADKAAAAKEKEKRDSYAREAKYFARLPARKVKATVSDILGRYNGGDWALHELKAESAKAYRAGREAKRRGWNQIAQNVRENRALIRAAIADFENRQAVARRHRVKRAAISSFRESLATVQGGGFATGATQAPAIAARHQIDLADSIVNLLERLPRAFKMESKRRLVACEMAARAEAATLKERAQAEKFAAEAEARALWLDGGQPRGYHRFSDKAGGALLRAVDVKRDDSGAITGGTLETSHGAEVPLVHALRVFAFLRLCVERGAGWNRNGHQLRVGHFQVDKVAPNGDFVAGCHSISYSEVQRVAALLGVADTVAPADTTTGRAMA